MNKITVADPCYEEANFRSLLEMVFLARKSCGGYELSLLNRILFEGLLEMTAFERLYLELSGNFSDPFIEDSCDPKDFQKIRCYQRTPKRTWDMLDAKRGYILDSKGIPPEFKVSWKEVKNILFLDPPEELVDNLSVPALRFLARWRIDCYDRFLREKE